MDHIRQPHAFYEFDRGARKFGEALGVIGIVNALLAVELLAVIETAVDHEEITHAGHRCAFGDRRKSQLISHGDGDARNQRGRDFVAAVTRQQHRHFVAHFGQRLGQRLHHVRQPAGLGVRQAFRG
jgi:hypothetical protein